MADIPKDEYYRAQIRKARMKVDDYTKRLEALQGKKWSKAEAWGKTKAGRAAHAARVAEADWEY